MHHVTKIFHPSVNVAKLIASEDVVLSKSQKLLLECGFMHPSKSGLCTLLPLAKRALNKLENMVKSFFDEIGAQPISFESLNPEGIWSKKVPDFPLSLTHALVKHVNNEPKYLFHEEAVAHLLGDVGPLHYKQFPLIFYDFTQVQRPVVDNPEVPEAESLTFNAYGVHAQLFCANETHKTVSRAFNSIFETLKLPVYRIETTEELSHDWHVKTGYGESVIDICPHCKYGEKICDDKSRRCPTCYGELERVNSTVVGNTSILDKKYTAPAHAHYNPSYGPPELLMMTSYGLKLTKILAATIETLSTEKYLRWPKAIAPYSTMIIGPKHGSKEWKLNLLKKAQKLGETIEKTNKGEVIIDDRHDLSIEERFQKAEKMGYPLIIVCGQTLTIPEHAGFEITHCTPYGKCMKQLIMETVIEEEINSLIHAE